MAKVVECLPVLFGASLFGFCKNALNLLKNLSTLLQNPILGATHCRPRYTGEAASAAR